MATPIPLRSTHLLLTSPAAIAGCQTLLLDSAQLLEFHVNPDIDLPNQIDTIRKTARTANTTRRLLQSKHHSLQKMFDQWSNIINKLSPKDDPALIEAEHDAFNKMINQPNGLYNTLDQITNRIQQLEFLEQDLNDILQQLQPTPPNQPALSPLNPTIGQIQLPKLELPTFSGDRSRWYDFWALFETTVDRQPHLSKVQKLAYLLGCLRGGALDATRGFHLHEDNYEPVIKALQLQFGNKSTLGRQLHDELRQLRNPQHTSTDLMRYHNQASRIIHQMEIAGIDTNSEHVIYELEDHLNVSTKTLMHSEKLKHHPYTPKAFLTILLNIALMLADVEPNKDSPLYQAEGQSRPKLPFTKTRDERPHIFTPTRQSSAFAGFPQHQNARPPSSKPQRPPRRPPTPPTPCIFCGEMHWNDRCTQYKSPSLRRRRATELHLCFLCLRSNHSCQNCTARKCQYCNGRHHKLLCLTPPQQSTASTHAVTSPSIQREPPAQTNTTTQPLSATTQLSASIHPTKGSTDSRIPLLLCQIARVFNTTLPQTTRPAKTFLDQGSQTSFITERFAAKLGLDRGQHGPLTIHGVGDSTGNTFTSFTVKLGILLTDGSRHILEAHTLPCITQPFLHARINERDLLRLNSPNDSELPVPILHDSPDLLIGSNFITEINPQAVKQLASGFTLYDSRIGPLIGGYGYVPEQYRSKVIIETALVVVGCTNLKLEDLWSLEAVGISNPAEDIEDDERALNAFNASIRRLPSGRYSVSWPWKSPQPHLTTNFGLCVGRLNSLLRQLSTNPQLRQLYHDNILQQLETGIIEAAPITPSGPLIHYIPHQSWLINNPSLWPSPPSPSQDDPAQESDHKDISPLTTTCVTTLSQTTFQLMDPTRFSSWNRLLGATTRALRYIKLISHNRFKWLHSMSTSGPITVPDRQLALLCLIKQAQTGHITTKDIARWDLQPDKDGIWRCHGRLSTTTLPVVQKFPIFLPRHQEITKLLIMHSHTMLMHAGIASTLAHLRTRYWIHQGRQTVRSVIHSRCRHCKRWTAQPFALPTAPPLPSERTQPSPPFSHTGVDYFGPINIKTNDGTSKRWVALFTCFITRAIHLEVADDLSALAFTNCFRRFISRRGLPKLMLSDNGTNFHLTAKALSQIQNYLSTQPIEWRFVTALTPWKGGLYERLIGIVKTAMRKSIGKRLLTEPQLITITTEIEAIINQRPLTYVEADSLEVLRPIDFLLPRTELQIIVNKPHPPDDDDYTITIPSSRELLLNKWEQTQQYLDRFWQYWQHSYLNTLRERAPFTHSGPHHQTTRPPHDGEIVLLKDPNLPRGVWKLTQIIKTLIGTGNVIRSAELRTPTGRTITRPISLLYPLEIDATSTSMVPSSSTSKTTNIPRLQTQPPQPSRRITRSMTKSITPSTSGVIISSLMALIIFFFANTVQANSSQLQVNSLHQVQLCPFHHTGRYIDIPPIRTCRTPSHWKTASVNIYKRRLIPINAIYCSQINRTVCTWTFLRWSLEVVNDTHDIYPITANECRTLHAEHKLQGFPLHPENSSDRWTTNNPVHYSL